MPATANKSRIQTGLTLIVGAIGLLFVAIMGLWVYVSATATPLHPNRQDVPSVTRSAPLAKWADAAEQGRQIVRAALTEQNLPGLSVAVGAGGDIVWAEGFGWADLDKKTPVAPETRFRIGTASMALTSAAVGLLLEKDRLNLDAEIQTYVPAFPKKQWPVTLRELMAHTAGLRNDGGDEGTLLSEHCERPADAVQYFGKDSLLSEPGAKYHVSSYGWVLMSAAVEAAAEEPFLRFMRKQVFEPLAMDDTTADSTTEPIHDRATSYFPRFIEDNRYGPEPMREVDYSCYSGSSVFMSTPSDLVRFALAINGGKLLKPETLQLFQASQRLTSGEETGYGLGWDLEDATMLGKSTHVVGHDGELLGGTAASFMTFPEYSIVVAVTSNTSHADTYSLAVKIAEPFAERARPPAAK